MRGVAPERGFDNAGGGLPFMALGMLSSMDVPVGLSRGTQVTPDGSEAVRGLAWKNKVLVNRRLDQESAALEEGKEAVLGCVTKALQWAMGVVLTLGGITGLVAWIKFSWNHV